MAISFNLYYTGTNGSARAFTQEMESSGLADKIRQTEGNLKYDYFLSMDDPETVLLIDIWKNQAALDAHHASETMNQIAKLRDKYDLHMKAERFAAADDREGGIDQSFLRK